MGITDVFIVFWVAGSIPWLCLVVGHVWVILCFIKSRRFIIFLHLKDVLESFITIGEFIGLYLTNMIKVFIWPRVTKKNP